MGKSNGENESANNRYRSPLDDLYKRHNIGKAGPAEQQQEEHVDEQFKQCQELLQRAKDRRMKMTFT